MAHEETLKNLQKALSMELSAAHQYQLHAHVLDDWGIGRLADKMRQEMHEELGHSDLYIERILFLKCDPDLRLAKPLARAQSLTDMFEADKADETEAIKFNTQAARQASDDGDIGSRVLFENIVLDEEGHKAWLELQLSLIPRMGEAAYVAKNSSAPSQDGEG